MAQTLVELWQDNAELIAGKTLRQIVQFSGEGKLRDGNNTSTEMRGLLAAVPLEHLDTFARECLASSFEDSGLVLQDIVNQIGVRLGFRVEPGRYRGKPSEVGFDGLWIASDGHALVLEVKTTDAFRMNLDTFAGYRNDLVAADRISESDSSILIAVGRQDTGDLEAQIRGSRHAWDVRLVSIDSLIRLTHVKEQVGDWDISSQINQVLRPIEYTRLDPIIELLFNTARDIEAEDGIEADSDSTAPAAGLSETARPHERVNKNIVEQARLQAIERIARHLGKPLIRKGRAMQSSSDGSTNVVCLVSKPYPKGPDGSDIHWFGFTRSQRRFVEDSPEGRIAFACAYSGRLFLIDRDEFLDWLPDMLTTPPNASETELRHWHIYFADQGDTVELIPKAGGARHEIAQHAID